jgi:LPPG:FO 2-phospho-L-lactate transferase
VKVVALAGGFGGARFVRALVSTLTPEDVTAIVNVGDDIEMFGVHISPDIDSVVYTLGGIFDEDRGWGRADETWNALETIAELGDEPWFRIGDRDLGLHLVRTELLRGGQPLSSVTARIARALGIAARVVPATDDRLRTRIATAEGELDFQEWFVARGHRDEVLGVRYDGAKQARPAPGVLEALAQADAILIAPSNPFVSIGPIVAVSAVQEAIAARRVPCIAVSPLIGGRTVKGPADRMLANLAGGTSPKHVASCYEGLIDALVVDEADADKLEALPVRAIVTQTLMTDDASRRRVAEAALGLVTA